MEPWEDYRWHRAHDRSFRDFTEEDTAQWLHIQIKKQARRLFPEGNSNGVQVKDIFGKPVLLLPERLAITVKKLTKRRQPSGMERLTRSNYLTPRNMDWWDQRQRDGFPELPRVILGYQLLQELTEIKLLIAYPRTRARGVEWAFKVPTQRRTLLRVVPPQEGEGSEEAPRRGFIITPAEPAEGARESGNE